jgi:hypothetical protein
MKTLRALLVYLVAFAFIPLVVVAFANLYPIARGLMGASGLTIAPHITGGPVAARVEHGAYATSIHQPVFESLVGRPREGFVQVAWSRKADVPASSTRKSTTTPTAPRLPHPLGPHRRRHPSDPAGPRSARWPGTTRWRTATPFA